MGKFTNHYYLRLVAVRQSLKQLFMTAILLLVSVATFAYDFEVDGIYYYKSSDNTVGVTCKELSNYRSVGYEDKVAITIPSTVEYDGVTYSVTEIGRYAFAGCSGLTSVTIPDGVTLFGVEAFYMCSGLTSIDIPDGVTYIGNLAFYRCTNMTSINVGDNNTEYKSYDGVLYNKDMTKLITCPAGISGSLSVPDDVTSIGENAFDGCKGLTSITIGKGVTSIGRHAFNGCSGLTSIDIPKEVTSIGESAFSGCI